MSFSSDVKKELSRVQVNMKVCEIEKAEAYGLLLFCRKFSEKEIYFRTESKSAAERFSHTVAAQTGSVVEISEKLTARHNNSAVFKVSVPSELDCERIFSYFGHDASQLSLRINLANIEYEACSIAFLRGAFLTCGTVSSPETEYRLEFNTSYKNLSEDLCRVIRETTELAGGRAASPKIFSRRGSFAVYLKGSEDIADFLTMIGADKASMTVMQVKIEKDRENIRNRKNNSYIANTDKSYSASAIQIKAIQKLENDGVMSTLSEELQEAAELRKNNPMASLKELVLISQKPISKSGLNHRLKKLEEIAFK